MEFDKGYRKIALAGNPNVGKSTVFNSLTGLRQHTGNWPGKTVSTAEGSFSSENYRYRIWDIPGTYSLAAHSAEEEVARDFICFGDVDAVVVVCDATCLERNLNLVLQIMETGRKVLLCVNLMDEAERKGIVVDTAALSVELGLPVTAIVAREKKSREKIIGALDILSGTRQTSESFCLLYPAELEAAVGELLPYVREICGEKEGRWLALRLLEGDDSLIRKADEYLGGAISRDTELMEAVKKQQHKLLGQGIDRDRLEELIVSVLVKRSREICMNAVRFSCKDQDRLDRNIDRVVTGRPWGYPVMILLLTVILYISIVAANYPSQLLSRLLLGFQDSLRQFLVFLNTPQWLQGILADGAYRVLAWVVSVMLPPMAVFFPLFTLLEDAGYLPRVAFNLDAPFKRCKACGKQALTMCMGFGCNAVGVTGCRIIDSERERLLAMLTNSFVPCNGRFPMLIAIISMFFAGGVAGGRALFSALLLSFFIVLAIGMSFAATRFLSVTFLRGFPSSYVLELPPYRRPQIGKLIVRSILDRTVFVLGRAIAVAAPAGALIWLLANVQPDGVSLISRFANFLEPVGNFMGMDGAILLAFILGFPANEIVLPLIIMIYTAQGSLTEPGELWQIREILVQNGWTWITAVSVMLFSLMHWPCSTTLLTIKKESGSLKWTALAFVLPAAAGFVLCSLFSAAAKLVM